MLGKDIPGEAGNREQLTGNRGCAGGTTVVNSGVKGYLKCCGELVAVRLSGAGLLPVLGTGLDFYEGLDQLDGGGGYAGEAAGLAKREGADAVELFYHFTGKAGAGAVVEPGGDGASFIGTEALHGALLLGEIAGEFDTGFDGFELVADPGWDRRGQGPGLRAQGAEPGGEDFVGLEAWEERRD